MTSYDEVFEKNRRWVEEKTGDDPGFFKRLAEGQNPDFLFVGCSDSRVPASVVTGLEPGDLFVHRNVANLVVNTDVNFHSVLHYAVDHLEVDHLVVCGHYGCGGVEAATSSEELGVLDGWLDEIRDVYRLYADELDAIDDVEQRRRRLVELNVREQCRNLAKISVVRRNYERRNGPAIHGWVYSLETGLLEDLEVPFEEFLED